MNSKRAKRLPNDIAQITPIISWKRSSSCRNEQSCIKMHRTQTLRSLHRWEYLLWLAITCSPSIDPTIVRPATLCPRLERTIWLGDHHRVAVVSSLWIKQGDRKSQGVSPEWCKQRLEQRASMGLRARTSPRDRSRSGGLTTPPSSSFQFIGPHRLGRGTSQAPARCRRRHSRNSTA